MLDFSVIIPVYQGEKTLEKLVSKLIEYFSSTNYRYEFIFVYDCGLDNSWEVLVKEKNKYPDLIKLVKLSRNFGQHNAIICGFEYAEGDFIVTMDEDLQHLPVDIEKLIKEQQRGDFDVVYGKYDELKHSLFRNTTSEIFRKMLKKGVPDLYEHYSAFRLIKNEIAKATIEMQNSYTFVDGYLSWVTNSNSHVIVNHREREEGGSSYSLRKLIEHSINIFVTFSNYPIRLLSKFSILLFLISFLYAIFVIVNKLIYDNYIVGYATYIIIAGMGISFILLALGILGEYIYRINLKTTKRPNYKVREYHVTAKS